jgi:hypothetical protein
LDDTHQALTSNSIHNRCQPKWTEHPSKNEAQAMNFMTALRQATSRIQTVGVDDETEAQACLRLACLAFDSPNTPDRAWALLGLDLLTVQADLYPDPAPVAVTVVRPPATDAPVRMALADLELI